MENNYSKPFTVALAKHKIITKNAGRKKKQQRASISNESRQVLWANSMDKEL